MHPSKLLICFLLIHFSAKAQVTYADDHPGVFHNAKPASVPGFPSYDIYQVFNKIPFINHPVGYDVREGTSIQLDKKYNVYSSYMMLGLPRYFYLKDKLELQGEYYNIVIRCNDFSFLAKEKVLQQETDRLHFPEFVSDTAAIQYRTMNGALVGEGKVSEKFWQSTDVYILNPRQTPFFVPVTTGEYLDFYTKKLQSDIDQQNKLIESSGKALDYQKTNNMKESEIKHTENVIAAEKNMLDFLQHKLKDYQDKAAHLSASEKKAPVTVMYPPYPRQLDKQGNPISPITGYLPYELYQSDANAPKPINLYHYNTAFFDRKLPKTAVQVMIFFNLNGYDRPDPWEARIRKEVFPNVDFKALAALMYH